MTSGSQLFQRVIRLEYQYICNGVLASQPSTHWQDTTQHVMWDMRHLHAHCRWRPCRTAAKHRPRCAHRWCGAAPSASPFASISFTSRPPRLQDNKSRRRLTSMVSCWRVLQQRPCAIAMFLGVCCTSSSAGRRQKLASGSGAIAGCQDLPVGNKDDGPLADAGRDQAVHELPDGGSDGQRGPLGFQNRRSVARARPMSRTRTPWGSV